MIESIHQCQKCPLHKTRHNIVLYQGPDHPAVLFVGEAPGEQEDLSSIPFVGRAGQLLRAYLERLKVIYGITNVIKCRPPDNKFDRDYAEQCKVYLEEQIKTLDPKYLVAVGNEALFELTGSRGITKLIGKQLVSKPEYGLRIVIPLIHPSAALRSPDNHTLFEQNWDSILSFFNVESVKEKPTVKVEKKKESRFEVGTSKGALYGITGEVEETGERQNFVHLHVHSEHSVGDAFGRLKSIVQKAKSLGFSSLAITDHGNLNASFKFYKYCKEFGINPIIGIEAYVSKNLLEEKENKPRHAIILAKNYAGFQDLCELSWIGAHQFYNKPRITTDQLIEFGKRGNLIVLSACVNSIAYFGDEFLEKLSNAYGDDFYLEIQPHNWIQQFGHNETILQIAEKYKKRVVVSNDIHYLNKDGANVQDIILKSSPQGKDPYTLRTLYMMTEEEMRTALKPRYDESQIQEFFDNTNEVAKKVNIEFPNQEGILPVAKIPSQNKTEYVRMLAEKGLKERVKVITPEYRERFEYELNMMLEKKFENYLLIIYNLLHWCRESNIEFGARGSVGGSLVAYCLYIHDTDPIWHKLYFERFISPNRSDLPDIDLDFQSDRRDEVIEYLKKEYGSDCVIHMGTWSTLSGKSCLRDVGRALDIPIFEINKIAPALIKRSGGDARCDYTIQDSFEQFEVCKEFDRKFPQVKQFAQALEGHLKTYGTHAAGIVVTPEPVYRYVPVIRAPGSQVIVSGYDGDDISSVGILKLDILGLITMAILKETKNVVKNELGDTIEWDKIDYEERAVFEQFHEGNTAGVFQFESLGITKMSRGMHVEKFSDLVALNALHRPGPLHSGLAADFIRTRNGFEERKKLHKIYDEVMDDTMGFPIYQEQILQVLRELGNMNWQKVNSIRKIIKHSTGVETFAKQRDEFVAGAITHDCAPELAKEIFERLIFFGSYGFNKCLDGSTIVYTSGGRWKNNLKKITIKEAFEKGITDVWGFDGKKSKCFPCKVMQSGIKPIYRVGTVHGRILTTKDHKFLTMNGWKTLEELEVGDFILKKTVPQAVKFQKGHITWNKGKKSIESSERMKKMNPSRLYGVWNKGKTCLNISESRKGMKFSEEHKKHLKESARFRLSTAGHHIPHTEKTKMEIREKTLLQYKEGRTGKRYSGLHRKVKQKMIESGFEGFEGEIPIWNFVWDEVNFEKKVLVEIHGDYWHTDNPKSYSQRKNFARDIIKENSVPKDWKLVIIREHEFVSNPKECMERISVAMGNPFIFTEIKSIKLVNEERMTYDIEVFSEEHNFLANGFVVHNSHAAEYAVLAYRCMWTKVHYPKQFMLALLKKEKDENRVSVYIKELKRLGFSMELPDVNYSKREWTATGKNFYMGLNMIERVKDKVAEQINAGQPFRDLQEFFNKIKLSKTEMVNLIKSQAFRSLCPNQKWLLENVELILENKVLLDASQRTLDVFGVGIQRTFFNWNDTSDYKQDEKDRISASVVPFPIQDTLLPRIDTYIEKYFPGIETVKIRSIDFDRWENVRVFIRAIVTNQVNWKIVGMEGGQFAQDAIGMEGAKYLHANSIDETDFILLHFSPEIYNIYKAEWDKKYFELQSKGVFPILISGRVNPYNKKITKIYVDHFIFMDEFTEDIDAGNFESLCPWAYHLTGLYRIKLAEAQTKVHEGFGELLYIHKVAMFQGKTVVEASSIGGEYMRIYSRGQYNFSNLLLPGKILRCHVRKNNRGNSYTMRKIFEEVV